MPYRADKDTAAAKESLEVGSAAAEDVRLRLEALQAKVFLYTNDADKQNQSRPDARDDLETMFKANTR